MIDEEGVYAMLQKMLKRPRRTHGTAADQIWQPPNAAMHHHIDFRFSSHYRTMITLTQCILDPNSSSQHLAAASPHAACREY